MWIQNQFWGTGSFFFSPATFFEGGIYRPLIPTRPILCSRKSEKMRERPEWLTKYFKLDCKSEIFYKVSCDASWIQLNLSGLIEVYGRYQGKLGAGARLIGRFHLFGRHPNFNFPQKPVILSAQYKNEHFRKIGSIYIFFKKGGDASPRLL